MDQLNKAWQRLTEFCKRERFGEIKIKIQDGVPVSLPAQIIKRENPDGTVTTTEINKAIDLTKEE
jgi:hypothetical protein